jgi:hypothetical protein
MVSRDDLCKRQATCLPVERETSEGSDVSRDDDGIII